MSPTIADRFGRKALSYGQVSSIQVELAQRLANSLASHLTQPIELALDIGCGTGHLTKHLVQLSPQQIHLLDISADMLKQAQTCLPPTIPSQSFVLDAEIAQWPTQSVDLVASASAIQWFHDPVAFLRKSRTWLKPQGTLAIATFGPQTLWQLHQAYQKATGRTLAPGTQMHTPAWWQESLSNCGYSTSNIQNITIESKHSSVRALFSYLQDMGVTGNQPQPLNKSQWKILQSELEAQAVNHEISLSWELIWWIAKTL